MSDYNATYWSKRIPQYLAEGWSEQPTPFAKLAATYFPPRGRILELGAGAGQDGLWFATEGFNVTMSDGRDIAFRQINSRAKDRHLTNFKAIQLDITKPFQLDSGSFDGIYAQLVLNYFDDNTLKKIIGEIERVLKSSGIFACMVNSIKDAEFEPPKMNDKGLIEVKGLMKRYFSKESFAPFVSSFQTLLFDENGRTPKDDSVGTSGMVQFIGKKT